MKVIYMYMFINYFIKFRLHYVWLKVRVSLVVCCSNSFSLPSSVEKVLSIFLAINISNFIIVYSQPFEHNVHLRVYILVLILVICANFL